MAWRGVRPVRFAIASVNRGSLYTVHTGKSDANAEDRSSIGQLQTTGLIGFSSARLQPTRLIPSGMGTGMFLEPPRREKIVEISPTSNFFCTSFLRPCNCVREFTGERRRDDSAKHYLSTCENTRACKISTVSNNSNKEIIKIAAFVIGTLAICSRYN